MKYDEYINKSTFLITSENCEDIRSNLYGYIIHNNTLFLNYDDILYETDPSDIGAYAIILRMNDIIEIIRDSMGLVQLYFFRNRDYWAVSNSFWKLCDEVGSYYKLNLNVGYAEALFYFHMMPYVYGGTLCKEIEALSAFDEIHIDVTRRTIDIQTHNRLENRVPLDSPEGMEILDDWIYRWSSVLKGLERGRNNIYCELSGGYDSRISFALANYAGIRFDDKNSVVYSCKPIGNAAKIHFGGDLEIAERLADIKKKKINQSEDFFENRKLSSRNKMLAYKEIYEGFIVQAFYPERWHFSTSIRLGGHMGESVRNYRHDERTITHKICIGSQDEKPLVRGYMSLVKSYRKICELTGNPDADSDVNSLRLEIECYDDIFFGKQIICELFSNNVMISPFMDISLRKIDVGEDIDPILIYAVILERICPEFLDIELAGKRSFSGEIKMIARLLCEKYPSENKPIEKITVPIMKNPENIEFEPEDDGNALQLSKKIFSDSRIKEIIINRLGETGEYMCEKAQRALEDEEKFANETYMMAILAIVRMIEIEKNGNIR